MPKFEEEIRIKSKPEIIYQLLTKAATFNSLSSDLEVKVIEKDEDSQLTDWRITTEKETFSWQQREIFDPEMLRIDYVYIKGDWNNYVVRWQITPAGDESDLFLQVEIRPKKEGFISYFVWPFFRRRMNAFCHELVQLVKDCLEFSYAEPT